MANDHEPPDAVADLTPDEREQLNRLMPVVMVPTSAGWRMQDEPDPSVVDGIIAFFQCRLASELESCRTEIAALRAERDRSQ